MHRRRSAETGSRRSRLSAALAVVLATGLVWLRSGAGIEAPLPSDEASPRTAASASATPPRALARQELAPPQRTAGSTPQPRRRAPSHEIAGRIVRDGYGVPDVVISLDEPFVAVPFADSGDAQHLFSDLLGHNLSRVTSDARGQFRFDGLEPRIYHLAFYDPAHPLLVAHRQVAAPAPWLTVDLSFAELEVVVTRAGEPAGDALVTIACADQDVTVRDRAAHVIALPPGHEARLTVTHPAAGTAQRTVPPLAPGARQHLAIDLTPIDRPSLVLTLPGAAAAGFEQVELQWFAHGEHCLGQPAPRAPGTDAFAVDVVPLEPGSYELIVCPHDDGGPGRFLLPVSMPVELPARGSVSATLRWTLGGRVEISVPGAHRLRLGDGSRRVALEDIGSPATSAFHWGSPPADAAWWARRCGIVPPGTYLFEVELDGQDLHAETVTVVAGEVLRRTRLVQLPPRR